MIDENGFFVPDRLLSSDEIHTFATKGRVRLASKGKVNKKKAQEVQPEQVPHNQLTIQFNETQKRIIQKTRSWPWPFSRS